MRHRASDLVGVGCSAPRTAWYGWLAHAAAVA